MNERKKSIGKIPKFGNWDYTNELPITQYFESAREAGLIRFSSSSFESDLYIVSPSPIKVIYSKSDLGMNVRVPSRVKTTTTTTSRNRLPSVNSKYFHDDAVTLTAAPKPVDEDLYKIPPHLLRSSKQKRMVGFFPRCLLPPCMV